MACYHPLKGYRPRVGTQIVFNVSQGYPDLQVEVPCGQCIGCRLERSRQWAVRCVHEAAMHDDNCWVTLTYDRLPTGGSLVPRDLRLFLGRLRDRQGYRKMRFYGCGEYGEKTHRPHYHVCLFNTKFDDVKYYKEKNGYKYYISDELENIWGHGLCVVGDLTFETAAYTARYITKKITGPAAENHYVTEDGEILEPEFVRMSKRPGIGHEWFKKYGPHSYERGYLVTRGKKMQPPRAYDKKFEELSPQEMRRVRGKRKQQAKQDAENQTPARLKVREKVAKAKLARSERTI